MNKQDDLTLTITITLDPIRAAELEVVRRKLDKIQDERRAQVNRLHLSGVPVEFRSITVEDAARAVMARGLDHRGPYHHSEPFGPPIGFAPPAPRPFFEVGTVETD